MKVNVSEMRGPLGELLDQCSGENGQARFEEFKLWLKKVTVCVLNLVTTVQVSGAKRFVTRKAFCENNPAGIKFYLWDNFKNAFLEKIEKDVPSATIAVHVLAKPSLDGPIRSELTSECEKTTLAYLYELISIQPNGELGFLLTDGRANIFYIPDSQVQVWAVNARWSSVNCEWGVGACSVAVPREWCAGLQVFSQVSSRSLDY